MSIFEQYLMKKDNMVRRRVSVDEKLYEKLEEMSESYDTSISKLVNIAIIELIKTQKVVVYPRPANEEMKGHNFLIRESLYNELETMKTKYGLSIFKLINIAIYNAINIKE